MGRDGAWTLAFLLLASNFEPAEGFRFPPERRGDVTVQLEVRVASPEEKTAEAVTLTVTVEGGAALDVEPVRLDDATEEWQARRFSSWKLEDGRATNCQSFRLRQLKGGFPLLPAVKVRFRAGPESSWEDVEWLNILRDLREPPPEPVPKESRRLPLWPIAALLGFIVGGCVLRRWWRRPLPGARQSVEERALRELDGLRIETVGPAAVYTQLSEVVRRYLAERFQLPAPRQTTEEFLAAHFEHMPIPARQPLIDFLKRCDLAKFAPLAPTVPECRETANLARAIIRACGDESGKGEGV